MKKKTIAAFGFFAVSVVMIFFHASDTANARLLDQSYSVNTLASYLRSPQDVALYMWRYFDYEGDRRQFGKEDYWQSPAEIVKNKKGDCEDFALFAKQILDLNGYSAYVLNLYGTKDHAICIFRQNGKYGAVDGGKFVAADFDDLRDLLSYMDPFWSKASIVEVTERHGGKELASIRNIHKPKKFFLFG